MEFTLLAQIVTLSVVLIYIAALVCAVEAILNGRTSQGAIAWTISLLSFPMLSLPLYLIFGRNRFAGYLEKRDEIEREAQRLILRTNSSIAVSYTHLTLPTTPYV